MGLDTYFFKTKKADWARAQEEFAAYEALPEEKKNETKNPYEEWCPEEIGYFRKVNFLMAFFAYYGNCEYKEIGRDEFKELVEKCTEVYRIGKANRDEDGWKGDLSEEAIERVSEILPTCSGFFFGSTDYDEWYFNEVGEVLSWAENVLDNYGDDEVVLMYCWW